MRATVLFGRDRSGRGQARLRIYYDPKRDIEHSAVEAIGRALVSSDPIGRLSALAESLPLHPWAIPDVAWVLAILANVGRQMEVFHMPTPAEQEERPTPKAQTELTFYIELGEFAAVPAAPG